jgi:hypothetical protein
LRMTATETPVVMSAYAAEPFAPAIPNVDPGRGPCRAVRAIAERPLATHSHHLVHAAECQRRHRPQAFFRNETPCEHRDV